MLMLFSVRVAEWPSVWERAVHMIYCACLSLQDRGKVNRLTFFFKVVEVQVVQALQSHDYLAPNQKVF